MSRKPDLVYLTDEPGFFTRYCHTREQAHALMQRELDADLEYAQRKYGTNVVYMNQIQTERMYECRKCSYYTIGENTCAECGRTIGAGGRDTFSYYFARV